MPKPPLMTSDESRNRQYRWECLRRSDEYRQDYREFYAAYPDWVKSGFDPAWPYSEGKLRGEDPYNPPTGGFIVTANGKRQGFVARWTIEPTDPKRKRSPFLNRHRLWVIDEGPAHNWAADPDVLTLCINTKGPLREVLAQLEWRIRWMQEQREKANSDTQKTRTPLSHLEGYLEAYDLRQEGQTYREIADTLGLPDEKTAKRHRQRAAELIAKAVRGDW